MSIRLEPDVETWSRGMFVPSRERVVTEPGPGRTKEEFRDECDLNLLMRRYEKTGVLPSMRVGSPQFVDCTVFTDFQSALQTVHDAERMFMALPSKVRREFENDPVKFVEFCSDPNNKDRLIELGLAERPAAPPEPLEVRVVNPDPPGSEAP